MGGGVITGGGGMLVAFVINAGAQGRRGFGAYSVKGGVPACLPECSVRRAAMAVVYRASAGRHLPQPFLPCTLLCISVMYVICLFVYCLFFERC